jgi:hypothetical protein
MRAETDVPAPSLSAHAEAPGEIVDGGAKVRSGVDEVIDHDRLNGSPNRCACDDDRMPVLAPGAHENHDALASKAGRTGVLA